MTRDRGSEPFDHIALVLQGGGALGAYQVGVYEALHEAGYCPDWVAGTSIGAIHAAIIAGNAPEDRLARLEAFWERTTRPGLGLPPPDVPGGFANLGALADGASALAALAMGQPAFFRPRAVNPWFAAPGSPDALSYYDTAPLAETLESLVDFERINDGEVRLSVGAVNIETGQQVYFDNRDERIGIEHILASTALPPAFPPVEIDGEWHWDGGVVSNTPIEAVLDDRPQVGTLCFMVDLFDASGPPPRQMDDVLERHKDIQYGSRSRKHIEDYCRTHNLRRMIGELLEAMPGDVRARDDIAGIVPFGCSSTMHLAHLQHRARAADSHAKDYTFSRAAVSERRAAGRADAACIVDAAPWRNPVPRHVGVVIHEPQEAPGSTDMSSHRICVTRTEPFATARKHVPRVGRGES